MNDPKGYKYTFSLLENDDDFRQMRSNYTQEFFERWKIGFQHYINGDWDSAAVVFEETKVKNVKNRKCYLPKKMDLQRLYLM